MPSLKDLVTGAHAGTELVVTGPHSRWLELTEDEQVPSHAALDFVVRSLRREFKKARPGRFSPSAMGECPRRVVFAYAGAPQQAPDIDNQEMMDHGTWGHLKWQVEGLTMGYMKGAEVWVHEPELKAGGSMDAVLQDDSIFELKTVGWSVYTRIVTVDRVPKWEHLLQTHDYMLLADLDMASIVYEDRSSGHFHEFRIPRSPRIEREVLRLLASYKSYVEADELPPMLDACEMRMGTVYKRCPYRRICPKMTSVSTASEAGAAS